jgi:hypothetical protein
MFSKAAYCNAPKQAYHVKRKPEIGGIRLFRLLAGYEANALIEKPTRHIRKEAA